MGNQQSTTDRLRDNRRALNATVREMERERLKLERQEKDLIQKMKKMVKESQLNAALIMAKDVVRTRANIKRFHEMAAQITAIGLRLQTLKSSHDISNAMSAAAALMKRCNRRMDLSAMQKIVMEFERNAEVMDARQEMMNEAIDDTVDDEIDNEEETDQVVAQILDELGADTKFAPVKCNSDAKATETSDLEERLSRLQK